MVGAAQPLLTEAEHSQVASAIRDAEKNTSGEIYCVLARTSDSYFWPSAFVVSAALLASSLVMALLLHHWWIGIGPVTFVAAQILALAVALAVLKAFPALRLRLVPKRLRYARAHANARGQFLAHNIHVTDARTGVLIFVSLAERYAEVIADAGINRCVPQETWNAIVETLIRHAREKRLADGFAVAAASVGILLCQHFPAAPHDRNELDDHVVEI